MVEDDYMMAVHMDKICNRYFVLCILENCHFNSCYIWIVYDIFMVQRYISWQELRYVHIICSQTLLLHYQTQQQKETSCLPQTF